MISPDLFSLLNLGIVLRITERGGEKVWSVLDYEISVRIKMEARSSFFYIKACYTELLVLKEQTWFSKRILGTWTVVGNAAGFGNWLDFLLSLCPFKFWPVFCGFFPPLRLLKLLRRSWSVTGLQSPLVASSGKALWVLELCSPRAEFLLLPPVRLALNVGCWSFSIMLKTVCKQTALNHSQ